MNSTVDIGFLHRSDELLWDDYVRRHEHATFYHQLAWRDLVVRTYGRRFHPLYLVAKEEGSLSGIFPLFLHKRPKGRRLISVPFANCGGYCADSKQVGIALEKKAIEIAHEYGVDYIELRNCHPMQGEWMTDNSYVALSLDLKPGPEALWKNLRSTTRRYIRRGQENELTIQTKSDDLKKFYDLYALGQRNLGTPVIGYRWIDALYHIFDGQHKVAHVIHHGKTIASVLLRDFKDTRVYVLGASLPEYRKLYPNYVLFWELINEACTEGFTKFEFGRSVEGSGSYFFKNGWGAEPYSLHYQYHFVKGKRFTKTSQSSANRKRLARVWKRMPLPLANALGPMIRRLYP